nr:ABC transporter permease [uncultured Actinoplanes sp.]
MSTGVEEREMVDRTKLGGRFWLVSGLAAGSGCLAVVTLISREWIEVLFGVDPDRGSGALEWAIVLALAALSVVCTFRAGVRWRRAAEVTGRG